MRDFNFLIELIQIGLFLAGFIYFLIGFVLTTKEGFISLLISLPCAIFLYRIYKIRRAAKLERWGK